MLQSGSASGIRKMMETDIEIMSYFAGLLEKEVESLRRFKPSKIVAEFRTGQKGN